MKTAISRKDKNTHNNFNPTISKFCMIPLIIIMCIIPLIMYYYEYDPKLSDFSWFTDASKQMDIFLYYKQLFFLSTCTIMLVFILYKVITDRKNINILPVFIPLFLYGILALLSTVFSEYTAYGIRGMFEQFESIFVILGYCLLVYYSFLFIKTEDDIRFIFKYFLIGILIMVFLGILQATGNDLFATDFGKKLYIPKIYWDMLDNFTFRFGSNTTYMTLYNPNYVGVYVALILPIITSLLFTERRKKEIILYIITIVGLIICLFGSKSKAGIIGLFISLFFVIIFFRKYIFKNKKIVMPIVCVGMVILITFTIIKFNTITNTINNLLTVKKSEFNLTDIKTEEFLTITYRNNDLRIKSEIKDDTIKFSILDEDEKNVSANINPENNTWIITDKRFSGIQITPEFLDEILYIMINIDGKDWMFTNQTPDKTYYFVNNLGKLDKIVKADSALFTGYESLATGRGYIWSRTLPLLKDNILLGSGADTFALEYPHQDYVNYYNAGFEGEILTKPHSMYLQIGVQSGVISLIAFLTFYLMYFISSFKLYIKGNFDNFFKQVGVAIFIGTIGYMITGISNDSTIAVAPIAWALIGIGIVCNYKVKEQIKNDSIEAK